jgi:hypothetical protein
MIYHLVNPRPPTEPRLLRAQESWKVLYDSGQVRPMVYLPKRTARDIGDTRDLPWIKDMLSFAFTQFEMRRNNIVCLTNDDTILHPDLPRVLEERRRDSECVSAHRVNLPERSTDHGRDLFAFTVDWILSHYRSIPDMAIGEMEWDLIMALIVREKCGVETKSVEDLNKVTAAELPPGLVMHERHEPVWMKPEMKDAPAKVWNRLQARRWYAENGMKHLCTI